MEVNQSSKFILEKWMKPSASVRKTVFHAGVKVWMLTVQLCSCAVVQLCGCAVRTGRGNWGTSSVCSRKSHPRTDHLLRHEIQHGINTSAACALGAGSSCILSLLSRAPPIWWEHVPGRPSEGHRPRSTATSQLSVKGHRRQAGWFLGKNQSESYVKSIKWNIFSVGGCGRGLRLITTYRMRSQIPLVKIRFLSAGEPR